MTVGRVFLDDSLGRGGCVCAASCQREVRSFRATGSASRAAGKNYQPFLPAELVTLPPPAFDHGLFALATLDLDAYADFDAVLETARTATEKRGRTNREIARAARAGYTVKPFAFAQHVPDIVDIHNSKDSRDGRPIKGKFYHQSVDELGGAPTRPIAIEPAACPQHHMAHWGVFQRDVGYKQGDVVTDERLVGYISLIRRGNAAWYSRIMGHGDHLKHGIMYFLHFELVRAFLAERPPGLRYLVFFEYARNLADQRVHWKKLLLFKPCYLHYADDRRVVWPTEEPPDFGVGLLALKTTLDQPWAHAVTTARELGVGAAWLALLHHAWVIEQARAPGLVAKLLRARVPSLEILRLLAPNVLPLEALGDATRIAVVSRGRDRGIDTLLPLADRGIDQVSVFHPDPVEREALAALYGARWSYGPLPDALDTDLIIVEGAPAQGWRAKRFLLNIDDAAPGLSRSATEITAHVAQLFGRAMQIKASFFRWGDPDGAQWVWVEERAE